MTDRELMQQAADKLSIMVGYPGLRLYHEDIRAVLTALQERLAQPVQRQPLTDEEIRFIAWGDFGVDQKKHLAEVLPLARAIEAAHGIKGQA